MPTTYTAPQAIFDRIARTDVEETTVITARRRIMGEHRTWAMILGINVAVVITPDAEHVDVDLFDEWEDGRYTRGVTDFVRVTLRHLDMI